MKLKDLLKDKFHDNMSVEDIETALDSIDLPFGEIEKLKTALTKSNGEAADYKKQLREKMTADELRAKEDAERLKELEDMCAGLIRKDKVKDMKVEYLTLGYDETMAQEAAEAMIAGDNKKVLEFQRANQEARDRKTRADILKETPSPVSGGTGSVDYSKKIEEAQNIGDYSAVAYYTRLSATAQKQE